MGLPFGLKLIDRKLNKGTPASIHGVRARRNYPLCIWRCNKECLLSKIPKQVLESLCFLPTYRNTLGAPNPLQPHGLLPHLGRGGGERGLTHEALHFPGWAQPGCAGVTLQGPGVGPRDTPALVRAPCRRSCTAARPTTSCACGASCAAGGAGSVSPHVVCFHAWPVPCCWPCPAP